MNPCSACGREIPGDSRLCPYCGESVQSASNLATEVGPTAELGAVGQETTSTSSSRQDSVAYGRFLPGTTLSGRYRVVDLLGRGGMGEVYRADDLELGQSVALKFLPKELAEDPDFLTRFRNEVRVARQISHPNVCRVYDIGSADGDRFLSMEFVDGEDLASVLRRMGRPSRAKSLEIARQLCAGLEAAHQNGVLHRDLKPANVMLDGRGRVRITDFGLAVFAEELEPGEIRSGTPQYMAPEQLAGKEVSERSDIYSLGLVLFEIFSGRKFREEAGASSAGGGSERGETSVSLSSVVKDIDPTIDQVVARCLADDPEERPRSALAVAAALPGGDPLAAALEAGETPSPELVAQAGQTGGIPAWKAWTLFASALAAAILAVLLSDLTGRTRLAMPEKTPQALAEIASTLVSEVGYEESTRHAAFGFQDESEYRRHLQDHGRRPPAAASVPLGEPGAVTFWYRGSADSLVPERFGQVRGARALGDVSLTDPPMNVAGMVLVRLDPRGRLLEFRATPSGLRSPAVEPAEPDFGALIEAAALGELELIESEPARAPQVFADRLAAWRSAGGEEVWVEAAALAGRPVSFAVGSVWNSTEGSETSPAGNPALAGGRIFSGVWFAALIASVVLGLRNLRLGRADRRTAYRLAVGVFGLKMLAWFFYLGQLSLDSRAVVAALGDSLQSAVRYWFYYAAIEPYFRRIWPHSLVSWTRAWRGRLRDPLVGQHLLVGTIAGTTWIVIERAATLLADRLGSPYPFNFSWWVTYGHSPRMALSSLAGEPVGAIYLTLLYAALLVFFLVLLRKRWLAVGACATVITASAALGLNHPIYWLAYGLAAAIGLWVLLRVGVFAVAIAWLVSDLLSGPVTLDFSTWYAGSSVLLLTGLVALAAAGFYISLGGQSPFGDSLIQSET